MKKYNFNRVITRFESHVFNSSPRDNIENVREQFVDILEQGCMDFAKLVSRCKTRAGKMIYGYMCNKIRTVSTGESTKFTPYISARLDKPADFVISSRINLDPSRKICTLFLFLSHIFTHRIVQHTRNLFHDFLVKIHKF